MEITSESVVVHYGELLAEVGRKLVFSQAHVDALLAENEALRLRIAELENKKGGGGVE